MKKVFIPIADGCEEIEVVTPVDILRRGGITVDLVSITGSLTVTGRNNIKISADFMIEDTAPSEYDMIVIPGGMDNVNTLKANNQILDLIKQYSSEKKLIGAICAGPLVLKEAGLLGDAEITSHPGVTEDLVGQVKNYLETPVVTHDTLITSRGAGTAEAFALELLQKLTDNESAMRVKREIVSP